MSLRRKLGRAADRLTAKFAEGETVGFVTVTTSEGGGEFAPPVVTETVVEVLAVVTGAEKLADGETVLESDRVVIVGPSAPRLDLGEYVRIDGEDSLIVNVKPVLSGGYASMIKYIVRRG